MGFYPLSPGTMRSHLTKPVDLFILPFTLRCYGLLISTMVPGALVPLDDQYTMAFLCAVFRAAQTFAHRRQAIEG